MYVCMYVCQKVALAVLPMERGNRLGQGEGSLNGPIFPTPRAELAHVTPPTAYYCQPAGLAANFALGLTGLPRGHERTNRVYPGHAKPGPGFLGMLSPKLVLRLSVVYRKIVAVSSVSSLMCLLLVCSVVYPVCRS